MLTLSTLAALGVQAILMVVDEQLFHRRRGLSAFERFGHVADSLAFGAALCVPGYWAFTEGALYVYIALAIFSAVLVTKDEWEHARCCQATENWIHALLFINHPVLLFCVGLLWRFSEADALRFWLPIAVFAVSAYQATAWILIPKIRRHA